MTIKDASHAVRVLEALVEQCRKATLAKPYRFYIAALVYGAKAVLKQYSIETDLFQNPPKVFSGSEYKGWIKYRKLGSSFQIIALAQAYATHMENAGMKVPGQALDDADDFFEKKHKVVNCDKCNGAWDRFYYKICPCCDGTGVVKDLDRVSP